MKKNVKSFVAGLTCSVLLSSLTVIAANTSGIMATLYPQKNNVSLYSNDKFYTFDSIIYNDLTYVPLRSVFNALDCQVLWDEVNRSVYVNSNFYDTKLDVKIKDKTYTFDTVFHYSTDSTGKQYISDMYISEDIMPLLADCSYDDKNVIWTYNSKEANLK